MSAGDDIAALKAARAEETDEPIETHERVIREDGSSVNSPVVNTSSRSRDELGFYPGETVSVAVYTDRVVIRKEGEERP